MHEYAPHQPALHTRASWGEGFESSSYTNTNGVLSGWASEQSLKIPDWVTEFGVAISTTIRTYAPIVQDQAENAIQVAY